MKVFILKLVRKLERSTENLLLLLYNDKKHLQHYRRIMLVRSFFRKLIGKSLTNSVEEGSSIAKQLISSSGFDGTQVILDYGCGIGGVGYHFIEKLSTGEYYGVDISGSAINHAKKNLSLLRGSYKLRKINDLNEIPHQKFDIVISQSVFTHNPSTIYQAFLREIRPYLKIDSVMLVNFAVSESESKIYETDYVYTDSQVRRIAIESGFNVDKVPGWLHPSDLKKSKVAPSDVLYRLTIPHD